METAGPDPGSEAQLLSLKIAVAVEKEGEVAAAQVRETMWAAGRGEGRL